MQPGLCAPRKPRIVTVPGFDKSGLVVPAKSVCCLITGAIYQQVAVECTGVVFPAHLMLQC